MATFLQSLFKSTPDKHLRRRHPRWRKPAIIVVLVSFLVSSLGIYGYAQVQTGERVFTELEADSELNDGSASFNPLPAGGDLEWKTRVPLSLLKDALALQIPEVLYSGTEVQSLVPYWSVDRVSINIDFRATRVGDPQLNIFSQQIEIIQPARLSITGTSDDLQETENREFIIAARYAFSISPDWQIELTTIEEPRVLGLIAPRLFASVTPDIADLEASLEAAIVGNLSEQLNASLNANGGLLPLVEDLSEFLGQERALTQGQNWPAMEIASASLVNQTLSSDAADLDVVLSLRAKDPETESTVPALLFDEVDASPLEVPFAFDATVADVATMLSVNERRLAVVGGELSVNKIKILRPHGGAYLVKIDADGIDPGGHRFQKRGTFHILVELGFDTSTQAIRVINATMPPAQDQLSFILSGRSWLQSDELALGLVSNLDGLPRQSQVSRLVSGLEAHTAQQTSLRTGTATWSTGSLGLAPQPTSYGQEALSSNFRARITPRVEFGL